MGIQFEVLQLQNSPIGNTSYPHKYSMKLTYRLFHEPQVRELNETKVAGENKQDSPMKKRNQGPSATGPRKLRMGGAYGTN